MSNRDNFYILGQAIAAFDPRLQRITDVCLSNLLTIPKCAPVLLRHVWGDMLENSNCREFLNRVDWSNFKPSSSENVFFWLGYYHVRDGSKIV